MSRSLRPDPSRAITIDPPKSTPQSRAAERAARGATDGSRPNRDRPRTAAWFLLTLLVLVVLVVVRLVTLTPSDVTLRVTAASAVTVGGARPHPTWPGAGQAALAVEGIGSLGSHGDAPAPTASLAKVMTAYLILKQYPLIGDERGFTVTVTPADAEAEAVDTGENQSVVAVRAGEQLDERQLLEALLIPSGDNIARMLAAHASGTDAAFVAEMNAEARSIGMDHTTYTDPSGFESSTVSTASDQLKIFERAMGSAVFRQIVSMSGVTLPVAGTLRNYDPLIADGYEGKTGSDSAAEGCLAFYKYETVDGHRLTVVGVVMGQGSGSDTDVILGAAGDAAASLVKSVTPTIRVHTVLPAHSPVALATSADGSTVRAETAGALRVIGWGGVTERLVVFVRSSGPSLQAGTTLGAATLIGGLPRPASASGPTSVRVTDTLGAPGLSWRLSHLL
jgi:D-alanyl-D-alanine carboxypeptidase (penicillin-binding protein 5/6)